MRSRPQSCAKDSDISPEGNRNVSAESSVSMDARCASRFCMLNTTASSTALPNATSSSPCLLSAAASNCPIKLVGAKLLLEELTPPVESSVFDSVLTLLGSGEELTEDVLEGTDIGCDAAARGRAGRRPLLAATFQRYQRCCL